MKVKPLVVIPSYLTEPGDLDVTLEAVKSVRKTAGESVDVLVVDDGSPAQDLAESLDETAGMKPELSFDFCAKAENTGFAKTVNVGLTRALEEGRHAILLNADVEITTPGWLRHFLATTDERGDHAAVIGALLLYPNGLIQHGGIYLSLLTRTFDHRFKCGPGNLPEALVKTVCPVTGAFQFIRHSTLERVGLYDEGFHLGWEDVDYCLRVFIAGEQCIYNPNIRAYHHEMLFRGRPSPKVAEWQQKSLMYLWKKYKDENMVEFVPAVL